MNRGGPPLSEPTQSQSDCLIGRKIRLEYLAVDLGASLNIAKKICNCLLVMLDGLELFLYTR